MGYPYRNMSTGAAICIVLVLGFCIIGWLANLQNLWEYWPETGKFVDVDITWIMSVVGIIIPIIGTITGWIF